MNRLTENMREMLLHAIGGKHSADPWRNYYNADVGSDDHAEWERMVTMGLARKGRSVEGPSVYFHVTQEGADALVKP
ncbi:MAG: hypothetical protein IPK60_22760 [Sandaracinaceae bacterium]|nr:hypothetical protein [Sandaracinaceae bacterium]